MNKCRDDDWNHETGSKYGPEKWHEIFDGAKGKHQSPINIDETKAIFSSSLTEPIIEYEDEFCETIHNNGFTFQLDTSSQNLKAQVYGGPLQRQYKFLQLHMHWSNYSNRGSEHYINNAAYSAEIHFVNWNFNDYQSAHQAIQSNRNDGLAVLAVMVKIGQYNEYFEIITKSFNSILLKNEQTQLESGLNISKLLPKNKSHYWTYPGSLTTPPCTECVRWIIFKEPIEMSGDQLKSCQKLYSSSEKNSDENKIKFNDRPLCPLGDRIVLKSFK
jgi:carbonic anhydrase